MNNLLIRGFVAFILAFSGVAYAQEDAEDCVYAVDIDDEDMSDYNICGKNSGINGVLNEILNSEDDGTTASVEFKEKAKEQAVNWISSPKALSERRFNLLQQIAKECPKGFEVKGEKYAVGPGQTLDLQFDYRCNN